MRISAHRNLDWCHLCGKRTTPLADIWYPENAEHDTYDGGLSEYIRICQACGLLIAEIAVGKTEKK